VRNGALDLFRAFAALSMIQGHSFAALLARDALGDPQPAWYTLLHGLTAPMFLLGAGLAFGLVLKGSSVSAQSVARRHARGLRRAGLLYALGYYLQLPGGSLNLALASDEAWERSVTVGPLQLTASCILIAIALAHLLGSGRALTRACLAWAGLTLLASPSLWASHASTALPAIVGNWLDGHRGSTFPFFPWSAFFAVGVASVELLQRPSERLGGTRLVGVGGVLAALAYAYHLSPAPRTVGALYWHAGTPYFVFRLGLCFVLLGALSFATAKSRDLRLPLPLAVLARHSLLAYVVHLILLYGSPVSRGLIHVAANASLGRGLLLTLFVMVVSTAACIAASKLSALRSTALNGSRRPANTQGS
jgi:uncharacterized membrane protein